MKDVFVLVNPASANGSTKKVWPDIEREMKVRGLEFRSHLTTGMGDATLAVRQALKEGRTTVISIGGDGTANEVVNGFFEGGAPINPAARLGLISRGTGCDLIRTLGIPKDFPEALETILANREKTIDLARVEFSQDGTPQQRYFANIFDAGLGAVVAARVNDVSKSAGGFLSFLLGTLKTILAFKSYQAQVTADGAELYRGPLTLAGAANGRYFGGGMHLAPVALIDDGELDLILVRGMGKLSLLVNLVRIYRGTHLTHPKVSAHRVREVVITGEKPIALEMDGETPGKTPAIIRVCPGALRVLC